MNASERAKGLNITTKIASVVNLFKAQFPDVKADLKPWKNDPDTRELVDPDSIDIGFHFPGWSPRLQCNSILVQIRFYKDPLEETEKFIGLETAGFSHVGQAWRFSTVENWQLLGEHQPATQVEDKLKIFSRQVFELFSK
ncbi:conserved hypothetical protein [Hyella patelloides LEGE 07179]|uniref:Uncharacterized protein n=1 Tax=Hyella patelloides LEGE 07179 TaxID=945734 RepID=A0A563VUM5_9CYAN|nr:hypothetical protein [Hyella patelloides]VEP15113.1 conserved hypothetical protein [Hyella patelloides LEGE 07179]